MKPKLSASAIVDYLICPKRFYYRLFKNRNAVPSKERIFGSIMHDVFASYSETWNSLAEGKSICFDKLRMNGMYEKFGLSAAYCLITFLSKIELIGTDYMTEYNFSIDLETCSIGGKFDVINPGKDLIVDWKTGSKYQSSLSNDIQFIIYNWAYKTIFDREPCNIYLINLSRDYTLSYKKSELLEKELFSVIIPKLVYDFENNIYVFPRAGIFTSSYNCKHCNFLSLCGVENELDS